MARGDRRRLDSALVDLGLVESREKAKKCIMAGLVRVDGRVIDKPGYDVPGESEIELAGDPVPYVSRGGLKLEKALKHWKLDVSGKVAMDIGASTGGFTDCLLQHGAKKVYAIDVGYGQLDWRLRNDPRVVVMERTNIRYLATDEIPENIDIITIDVSFISLTLFIGNLIAFLAPDALVVALVKPQFEAGREQVGKKGVVRDPAVHRSVLEKVAAHCIACGFQLLGVSASPITGPQGNIEFLMLLGVSREGHAGGERELSACELRLIENAMDEASESRSRRRKSYPEGE